MFNNPAPLVDDCPGEVSSLYHVLVLDPHEPSNRLESLFSHAAYVHRVGLHRRAVVEVGNY